MLEVKNMWKSFNRGTDHEINVFRNFSLSFIEGESTAIVGANGCGKSTLLNLISGSLPLDSGKILLKGRDISLLPEEKRSSNIGRVHQNPSFGVSPSLTILENLALANKKGDSFSLRNLVKKDSIPFYKELLKTLDLGLENKIHTQVKFLSGGQRQSLSLLMATMKDPDLLLLDEHTAALDPKTSFVVMEKTKELIEKNNITTVMISHNMSDALKYSQRIIMMDKGEVILDKRSCDVSEKELLDIYTKQLVKKITA